MMRGIGVTPSINHSALELSYNVINNFCIQKLNNKKITFFTTGTVAQTAPDLLKQIFLDGHEVASHYHYHDLMYKQSNYEINKNLEKAKNALFSSTGEEPLGFRAPVFSIPDSRKDIFQEIEKFFHYDSSFVLDLNANTIESYQREPPFSLESLIEFPIIPKHFFFNSAPIKSGGTFLRLFTKEMIKEVMDFNTDMGFPALIYMHPYDYLTDREFWVPFKHFLSTKKMNNLIKYFRQLQWIGVGNKSVFSKLDYLLEHYEHQGPMKNLIINAK
jgi:hypothetical protein